MTDSVPGVLAAVLSPLDATLAVDIDALARHCRWLLDQGCDGLSVLGTTGEANSFSLDERRRVLDGLGERGLAGALLLPGTGCCAIEDTVQLSATALAIGATRVLMLPPFYYKGVSDDGLFAYFAEVIERLGDGRLRIFLYHFPQLSGVALGPALIERLLACYPGTIVGMKDSSGDFAGMVRTVRAFPGFTVLTGSDEFLLPLLREGGGGCITGVSNVAAAVAAQVLDAWRQGDGTAAEQAQARLSSIRQAFVAYPLTAALKEVMAEYTGAAGWRRIRPPLIPLLPAQTAALSSALDRLGFSAELAP